jgi:hypothetical protein
MSSVFECIRLDSPVDFPIMSSIYTLSTQFRKKNQFVSFSECYMFRSIFSSLSSSILKYVTRYSVILILLFVDIIKIMHITLAKNVF